MYLIICSGDEYLRDVRSCCLLHWGINMLLGKNQDSEVWKGGNDRQGHLFKFHLSEGWKNCDKCSLISRGKTDYFLMRQTSQERSCPLFLQRSVCKLLGELRGSWIPMRHQHCQNRNVPWGRDTWLVVEKSALAVEIHCTVSYTSWFPLEKKTACFIKLYGTVL